MASARGIKRRNIETKLKQIAEKLPVAPIPDAQARIAESLIQFWDFKSQELVHVNSIQLDRNEPDYLKKLSELTMAQARLLDYMLRFAKACAGEIDAAKADRDQTENEKQLQAELIAKTNDRTARFFKD